MWILWHTRRLGISEIEREQPREALYRVGEVDIEITPYHSRADGMLVDERKIVSLGIRNTMVALLWH